MKGKNRFRKIVFALILPVSVLFAAPCASFAQSVYPPSCDFELRCEYNGAPLRDMSFSFYRVADMPSLGKFSLLSEFAASGVDVENIEKASDWKNAAAKLAKFAKNNSVSAFAEKITDENGAAGISSVGRGLYLVVGKTLRVGDTNFSCAPFLVSLPDFDENSGKWIFNVTAEAKIGSSPVEPEPTTPTTEKQPGTDDPNDLAEWVFPLVVSSVGFIAVLCMFVVITKRGKEQN